MRAISLRKPGAVYLLIEAAMFLPKHTPFIRIERKRLNGLLISFAQVAAPGHSLYFHCVSLYRTQISEQTAAV
jgi:hypothetical protein